MAGKKAIFSLGVRLTANPGGGKWSRSWAMDQLGVLGEPRSLERRSEHNESTLKKKPI